MEKKNPFLINRDAPKALPHNRHIYIMFPWLEKCVITFPRAFPLSPYSPSAQHPLSHPQRCALGPPCTVLVSAGPMSCHQTYSWQGAGIDTGITRRWNRRRAVPTDSTQTWMFHTEKAKYFPTVPICAKYDIIHLTSLQRLRSVKLSLSPSHQQTH